MHNFLSSVLDDLLQESPLLAGKTIVLPNKRSGTFFRKIMKDKIQVNSFLPRVISIDELMEEVSGFTILDQITLVFEFYSIYRATQPKGKADSFEVFYKWARILLQDFSELDTNLKDPVKIFNYISESKRLENWDLDGEKRSEMLENYLDFHQHIAHYYTILVAQLEKKQIGYQGLVYRKAKESTDQFSAKLEENAIVFAGFNALGASEEYLISTLASHRKAKVYWDDDDFYETSNSSAGSFFKKYRKNWPSYKHQPFQWTDSLINTEKTIHLIGLPKQISQIKEVGNILFGTDARELEETAVVLGNEKLLPSLLQSLPGNIDQVNVTMGYELVNSAVYQFLESLFQLQVNSWKRNEKDSVYYKDLENLFQSPLLKPLLRGSDTFREQWQVALQKEKTVYFSAEKLSELAVGSAKLSELFKLLFTGWNASTEQLVTKLMHLLQYLRQHGSPDALQEEILFRHFQIFEQLKHLNARYQHMRTIEELFEFFRLLLRNEKLSFQGEPLAGLQIMGLLESRTLDFKNVIITSVNEGFLPANSAQNSFIPLDIKREYDLPTPAEKDAIFTYHFFRLFHRAQNIRLLYNNITDDFGSGEPSRFISQLEIAKSLGFLDKVNFKKSQLSPKLPNDPIVLNHVPKTTDVLKKIIATGQKGFSPSSLTMYIRNPLEFYKRRILGVREYKEMEEHMAHNTFGTVVHDTLEMLYKPFLNTYLTEDHIRVMKKSYQQETETQFKLSYAPGNQVRGKNFLSLEIAKQFVLNFLNYERDMLRNGSRIRILGLEKELSCALNSQDFPHPVVLKGKIDRIDEIDGVLRILDYKTGKVSRSDLKIKAWEDLITDYKYSKAFQVLTYAWMYNRVENDGLKEKPFKSGIISFKNLKDGFLGFNNSNVEIKDLENFEIVLKELLHEIYDAQRDFEEKELIVHSY